MRGCEACAEVHPEECSVHTIVSDPSDKMDQMIQAASIPNLASLFKKAQDAGVIVPGKEYGNSN